MLVSSLVQKLRLFMLLFLATILVSACDQSLDDIEADDFGFPKRTIYAKGQNVTGEEENQLSEWSDSGYKYNGDQIVIMVYNPSGSSPKKNTWNAWLCDGEDNICASMYDAWSCSFPDGYCSVPDDTYETINNAPCYMERGEGLYLLITDPARDDIEDPNTYDSVNRLPSSAGFYTKSLWDETSQFQNGQRAYGYSGELVPVEVDPETGEETENYRSAGEYVEGTAWFKILDRYYEDNSGSYKVSIKRGFDQSVPPPIASVISFVTDAMKDTAESLYKEIVANSDYLLWIKMLLVIYIVVHGILYLGGASQMNQREFVSMFIRMIIVIQLTTSTTSWDLFNNYFFKFFTEGLDEMISIVTSNISDGTSDAITFFDKLLNLLYSYETSIKLYAAVNSFPSGFVVTIISYIGFFYFTFAIAEVVILYLLSYLGIALLIIVAPIFICFMLFEITKPLFENWLNQFVALFLQAVITLAALNLFAQMIVDQIYMMFGYKACFEDWISVGSFVIAKSWFICSTVKDTPDSSTSQSDINDNCEDNLFCYMEVPGYGYNDGSNPDYYCEPYECWDNRHVELPFLDPDISKEADLIEAFRSPYSSLSIPMMYESCVLLLMCYLMGQFNKIVPSIVKGVSGGSTSTSGVTGGLGAAAGSVMQDFKASVSAFKNAAMKQITGKSQNQREVAIRSWVNKNIKTPLAETGVGKAVSTAYHTAGFVKDMIIPPGSFMLASSKEREEYRKARAEAKEELRQKDAQEGYYYDKSYRDRMKDFIEDNTGITKFKKVVNEFDASGKKLYKEIPKALGRMALETETGQTINQFAKNTASGFNELKTEFRDEFYKMMGKTKTKTAEELEQERLKKEQEQQEQERLKEEQEKRKNEEKQKEKEQQARVQQEIKFDTQIEDACKILGVDRSVLAGLSKEEQLAILRKAYRKAALKYHPDKNHGNEKEATEMFKKAQSANEQLVDFINRGLSLQPRATMPKSQDTPEYRQEEVRKKQEEEARKQREQDEARKKQEEEEARRQREQMKKAQEKPKPMTAMESAYQDLGISGSDLEGLTRKKVESFYRKAALKCHPDKNQGNEVEAAEKFRRAQSARDFLINKLPEE